MKSIRDSQIGLKRAKMKRLTKEEKKQLIRELRKTGWMGGLDDKSALILAEKILEYQLKENE